MPCNTFYIQVDLKNEKISEPSQNHLKTISKPSQNHLRTISQPSQLDLWGGLRLSVDLRSVYRCQKYILHPSWSKKMENAQKPSQNHLKTISNHLKTISNHLKPSQPISVFFQVVPGTSYKPQKYSGVSNNVFCIPMDLKNMKTHQNRLITISKPSQRSQELLLSSQVVPR